MFGKNVNDHEVDHEFVKFLTFYTLTIKVAIKRHLFFIFFHSIYHENL